MDTMKVAKWVGAITGGTLVAYGVYRVGKWFFGRKTTTTTQTTTRTTKDPVELARESHSAQNQNSSAHEEHPLQ